MFDTEISVPFTIPGVSAGFVEVHGMLNFRNDTLILEFESKDALVGAIRSPLREVQIPLSNIKRLEFRKKWFSAEILLFAKSMSVLKSIPGTNSGMLKLKLKRRDRDEGRQFCSSVQLALSEVRLRELDEGDSSGD